MAEKEEEKGILSRLISFYFSNSWYSFFTITYLLFFLYSAIFYLDNVLIALRFLLYTLGLKAPLLGLGYLFWGAIFMISLIIPFSVSISAIIIFYNLWEKISIQIKQKFIATIFIIMIIITIIITMDDVIRNVARQPELEDFVVRTGLYEKLIDNND